MTKRELVIAVADRLGYTQNEVSNVIQAALDAIVESLATGDRLEIRNFGVFEVKSRDARIGRNPRTGEEVPIEQKRVASFKPGKMLKERVQTGPSWEPPPADAAPDPEGMAGPPDSGLGPNPRSHENDSPPPRF